MNKIYKIIGKFYTNRFENVIGKSEGKYICRGESVKSTRNDTPVL